MLIQKPIFGFPFSIDNARGARSSIKTQTRFGMYLLTLLDHTTKTSLLGVTFD